VENILVSNMKDNGKIGILMEKVLLNTKMDLFMKVNLLMVRRMVLDVIYLQMETYTKEIFDVELNMAKDYINIQQVIHFKVNFIMTTNKVMG
jgi:hypothetical protein